MSSVYLPIVTTIVGREVYLGRSGSIPKELVNESQRKYWLSIGTLIEPDVPLTPGGYLYIVRKPFLNFRVGGRAPDITRDLDGYVTSGHLEKIPT